MIAAEAGPGGSIMLLAGGIATRLAVIGSWTQLPASATAFRDVTVFTSALLDFMHCSACAAAEPEIYTVRSLLLC